MRRSGLQLLSVLNGLPVFTKSGDLYIGDTKTSQSSVFACATLQANNLIAVITLQKFLIVSKVVEARLEQLAKHEFPKRLTRVLLPASASKVIVSDAFGDVYCLPVEGNINLREESEQDRFRILGHFSTITDVAVGDGLIASGDRDNKIRVSRYPGSYVIESFCLGHEEFVSCLHWAKGCLVSGGGDGVLRLWDKRGAETCCLRVGECEAVRKIVGEGLVTIAKIRECPWDKDKLLFVLTDCHAVFGACGMNDGALKDVESIHQFDDVVTGAETFNSMLWVSTEQMAYKLGDGECDKVDLRTDEWDGKDWGESQFRWLEKQRKKEMVEDWKGKKRRFAEV